MSGRGPVVNVEVVETPELGDRSYVAHDGTTAVVIDPQRDIDRIEGLLIAHRLRCAFVAETHVHNDYVSGGLELSRRTGATYLLAAGEPLRFERHAVGDGDELPAGRMRLRVVATPGHTFDHVAYVVDDGGAPVAFTGGSLLFGSVGRTDLLGARHTATLARLQFRSARQLAGMLADDVPVYPTHGFGSFCSSGNVAAARTSTIGAERARNDAFALDDEDAFVTRLVAGLTAYPAYYAHVGPINRGGPAPADLSPVGRIDRAELSKRIASGEWVVDLRTPAAFAHAHLAGTISIALDMSFSTYLGWLIPWGTPLTLMGATEDVVAAAQRQLVRIGIDRPAGAWTGAIDDLAAEEALRGYPVIGFADLATARDVVVVDVRRHEERQAGHLAGSFHLPVHDLLTRLDDLPEGRLALHCASGYRAAIAASLLDGIGRDVLLVEDDWENAAASGLALVTPDHTAQWPRRPADPGDHRGPGHPPTAPSGAEAGRPSGTDR
jgi:glyoxylase-like metal-dependent hydrolase (beta-lactamase superfamily II)/rhodanese-related sulfurtransferase